MAEGDPRLQQVAVLLALGLAPGASDLDEAGLPQCFGRETLQSPAELQAQARRALLGTRQPPEDATLDEVLDAVFTLARELAHVVTDPMRAEALGFSGQHFQTWVQKLENAARPGRVPARLLRASDDATAGYLAFDLMPRMKRWKDQYTALGVQPPHLDLVDGSVGMTDALRRILQSGTHAERAAVAPPRATARPRRRLPAHSDR